MCIRDRLKAAFDAAGVDLDKPLVTTCGSGMTATVVAFGAHLLGKEDVAVYDGSWVEWGADPATPKATGAASVSYTHLDVYKRQQQDGQARNRQTGSRLVAIGA